MTVRLHRCGVAAAILPAAPSFVTEVAAVFVVLGRGTVGGRIRSRAGRRWATTPEAA